LRVFARIILCKLLFDHNASFYSIYGFNEKRISQCSEYLSKKGMTHLQRKINPSRYVELVTNKLAFYERCTSNNIPTSDILAIISDTNITVPHNIPVINDKESLSAFFTQYDNKMFFFKIIDGAWGHGVLSVKLKDGNTYDPFGTKLTLEAIVTHCLRHKRSFLVQEHLAPHKDVKALMPGPALGTFRLVTLLQNDKNKVKIPYEF
jgi:glutathione synthase/RimK-type ligase-like ATP-grasp enzyme